MSVDPAAASEQAVQAWSESLGIEVDGEFWPRIRRYLDQLDLWNRTVNLTGDRDRDRLIRHHVADCLAPLLALPSGRWVDIGSGAGLPGIVLASARPATSVVLVESRAKRVTFLREVTRMLSLANVSVLAVRAETLADSDFREGVSGVTGRAVRLDELVRLGAPMLTRAGRIVAMQTDETHDARVDAALADTGLSVEQVLRYETPSGRRCALVVLGRA